MQAQDAGVAARGCGDFARGLVQHVERGGDDGGQQAGDAVGGQAGDGVIPLRRRGGGEINTERAVIMQIDQAGR